MENAKIVIKPSRASRFHLKYFQFFISEKSSIQRKLPPSTEKSRFVHDSLNTAWTITLRSARLLLFTVPFPLSFASKQRKNEIGISAVTPACNSISFFLPPTKKQSEKAAKRDVKRNEIVSSDFFSSLLSGHRIHSERILRIFKAFLRFVSNKNHN